MGICRQFYFRIVVSLVWISLNLTQGENRDAYMKMRDKFFKTEGSWRIGGDLFLVDKEVKVNQKVMALKTKEMEMAFKTEVFPPAMHFFEAKPFIENSTVFKIIQKMPKGAALHLHDSSLVDVWWLVKNVTYMDHCYMCIDSDKGVRFKFANKTPRSNDCMWSLTSDWRKHFDAKTFDQWLYSNLSLVVSDPEKAYPTQAAVWKKFLSLFSVGDGLIYYKPVFEAYFREAIQQFYDDNVQYFEFRSLLTDVTDINGKVYEPEWMVATYKNISDEFVREHPDYVGTKMIYSASRSSSAEKIGKLVNLSLSLQKKFPSYMMGFDLVGQEDPGHTLKYFLDQLLYPSQHNMSLKYFFHAGETDWLGSPVDDNLIDAVLLNTSRIGHGFALTKHPSVMKLVKEKGIAIEVCPISNQVLKLVDDLRDHPASSLFMDNYPVVVSPDDPGLWSAKGLSYDFYQAFMGLGGEKADLAFLKQLAINSIEFSAMSKSEKMHAQTVWISKWNQFLDYVLNNY